MCDQQFVLDLNAAAVGAGGTPTSILMLPVQQTGVRVWWNPAANAGAAVPPTFWWPFDNNAGVYR